MRIDVVTIFPEVVEQYTAASLLGRARRAGHLVVRCHDPRDHTTDVHRTVDDAPYGGGPGMVMRPEPLFAAVEAGGVARPLYLLDPGGRRFDQRLALELASTEGFSLLCGRYEGVDDRVRSDLVDDELSVGDVVLAGGELAALIVIEAVARLVPGVLGNAESPEVESFRAGRLEHPQWTRPAEFRDREVPAVLRSGDHALVDRWRRASSVLRTARLRPDLLVGHPVDDDEAAALDEFGWSDDVAACLEDHRRTR